MSKFIKHLGLRNTSVSFKDTYLRFNEECIAEVSDEHAESILELKGYELVEDEKSSEEAKEPENKEPENAETLNSAAEIIEENIEESEVAVNDDNEEDLKASLDKMTIKQLNRYAASENINLGSASKKDDIVSVIVQAKESK